MKMVILTFKQIIISASVFLALVSAITGFSPDKSHFLQTQIAENECRQIIARADSLRSRAKDIRYELQRPKPPEIKKQTPKKPRGIDTLNTYMIFETPEMQQEFMRYFDSLENAQKADTLKNK